jgi:excisionase family DNA binding protein
MDELLTLKQLSEYLKIAEKTLYGYAQKGKIPGIRIGSAWRFRKGDIERWLDEQRRLTESSYSEGKGGSAPRRGPRRKEVEEEGGAA